MGKIIKMTPEYKLACREEFEKALSEAKLSDGKITFTKTFDIGKREAIVHFTLLAWMKMQSLIREFNKEVAWHGVAYRDEDMSKDEYYITDILVYPQEVTGSNVNTDQVRYQQWLMEHDDDVFNNIRMQGHSHVNMSVSPSGVDLTHQEKILSQLEDDMFYIFMIWNKSGSKNIKIYDLAKNVLFETSDIAVEIDGAEPFEEFIKNAKEMVKEKTYGYQYGSQYGGGAYSYQYNKGTNVDKLPVKDVKTDTSKEDKKVQSDTAPEKRKGKRKDTDTPSTTDKMPVNQVSFTDYEYDPDYPYNCT